MARSKTQQICTLPTSMEILDAVGHWFSTERTSFQLLGTRKTQTSVSTWNGDYIDGVVGANNALFQFLQFLFFSLQLGELLFQLCGLEELVSRLFKLNDNFV